MCLNESIVENTHRHNQHSDKTTDQQLPLRNYVEQALCNYFDYLGEENVANLYTLVITEVEGPLLQAVLKRANGNQSKAAQMLGLNRGTFRKKLKQYNIA